MNGIIGKYHVSKNLFDATWESGSIGNAGGNLSDTNAIRTVGFIVCEAEKLYSFNPEYDVTETWVNYYDNNGGLSRYKITDGTFTTPQGCTRLRFRLSKTDIGVAPVPQPLPMLNVGTPLPYEPYDTEVWHDISYARLESATDTLSALPVTTYNDGTSATVAIKGNMAQTGTPTPSAPIQPIECGVRTENLFDDEIASGYYNDSGTLVEDASTSHSTTYIPVNGTIYTVSGLWYRAGAMSNFAVYEWDSNKNWLRRSNRQYPPSSNVITFTIGNDAAYITLQVQTAHGDIMLNAGSTAKPFEPYGFKIPISSGGVTTNIYLGSTQTVRPIKKLVLTGDENWIEGECSIGYRFRIPISSAMQSDTTVGVRSMCTHQQLTSTGNTYNTLGTYTITGTSELFMTLNADTRLASWKSWLAAQYANGTPVTVWYVLATPETGIVNEPLRKIGDYADSVSVANIPTTAGGQTFDVDTTLKPSEVSLTYHGWHEHEAEKRENGSWT